jgi:hypothetical protein
LVTSLQVLARTCTSASLLRQFSFSGFVPF